MLAGISQLKVESTITGSDIKVKGILGNAQIQDLLPSSLIYTDVLSIYGSEKKMLQFEFESTSQQISLSILKFSNNFRRFFLNFF